MNETQLAREFLAAFRAIEDMAETEPAWPGANTPAFMQALAEYEGLKSSADAIAAQAARDLLYATAPENLHSMIPGASLPNLSRWAGSVAARLLATP